MCLYPVNTVKIPHCVSLGLTRPQSIENCLRRRAFHNKKLLNKGRKIPAFDISDFSFMACRAKMKSQRKISEALLERHFYGASKTALEEEQFTSRIH